MPDSIDYKSFISKLNKGEITEVIFHIKDYAHYSNCSIVRTETHYDSKTLNATPKRSNEKKEVILEASDSVIFIVTLTRDGEGFTMFGRFDEKRKLFKMGKSGTFTLKQLWGRVIIDKIN